MIFKKNIFLFFIYVLGSASSFAQYKKEIKKNKIKSITEITSIIENGKEISYKSYFTAFDKNGKITEETEFNKNGSIKKKQTTKYDADDNKTEETSFYQPETKNLKSDPVQKEYTNTKTTYKYNTNNDKTEEDEFDQITWKLIKKQVYSYNNKGEKIIEITFDAENKPVKRITYDYNNKGLKTEKKFFDKANVLDVTKKYTYEF